MNKLGYAIFFLLLLATTVNASPNWVSDFDTFKADARTFFECIDLNIEELRGYCLYPSIDFLYNLRQEAYTQRLVSDPEFKEYFEQNGIEEGVRHLINFFEQKHMETYSEEKFIIAPYYSSGYRIFLDEADFIDACKFTDQNKLCKTWDTLKEEYKSFLEDAEKYWLDKLVNPPKDRFICDIRSSLAKVGRHLVGQDNNILYPIPSQGFAPQYAASAFGYNYQCGEECNGNEAVECYQWAGTILDIFDENVIGPIDANHTQNVTEKMKKRMEVYVSAANESKYIQDQNLAKQLHAKAALSLNDYASNLICEENYCLYPPFKLRGGFDDHHPKSKELFYQSMYYSAYANDEEEWERAFNGYFFIVGYEIPRHYLGFLLSLAIGVFVFAILLFIMRFKWKKLSVRPIIDNLINKKSILAGVLVTLWVGMTFGLVPENAIFSLRREIFSLSSLSLRNEYLNSIVNLIKQKFVFDSAWTFTTFALFFLVGAFIFTALNKREFGRVCLIISSLSVAYSLLSITYFAMGDILLSSLLFYLLLLIGLLIALLIDSKEPPEINKDEIGKALAKVKEKLKKAISFSNPPDVEKLVYGIQPKIPLKEIPKELDIEFVKPITRLGILTRIEIKKYALPEGTSEAMREIHEVGLHNALTSTLAKISFELDWPIKRIPRGRFFVLLNSIYWIMSIPQILKSKNRISFPTTKELLFGYSGFQELLLQYYYEGLISKDVAMKFIQFYKILEYKGTQTRNKGEEYKIDISLQAIRHGIAHVVVHKPGQEGSYRDDTPKGRLINLIKRNYLLPANPKDAELIEKYLPLVKKEARRIIEHGRQ